MSSIDDNEVDDSVDGGAWRDRVVKRSLEVATQRSLDRSHAFVNAGLTLVDRDGDSFTVQDVCDEAGYSMRLFYQYFSGKDDLLVAVLEEAIGRAVKQAREAAASESDSLRRLAQYLNRAVTPSRTTASRALARFVIELGRSHPEELARAHRPQVEFLSELIDEAVESGALPPGETTDRVYCISLIRSAYNQSRQLGNEYHTEMPTPMEFTGFCLRALGADHTVALSD